MSVAFDFNEVPGPSSDEIKANDGEGALTYGTGAQQSPDYIAGLEAAGLHTVEIWEHNVDSILGGYDYGVSECQAWEASHPAGKLVYLACDLNDGALAGRDPLPFCRGWADTTREAAFGVYGPDDFLLAAMASGIKGLSRFWGVVNWIRGGAPDNAQSNIDFWTQAGAHIVQLIGSPIANTDQNLILKPDWWTTGGTAPATPKEDLMYNGVNKTEGWFVVEGGKISFHYTGAPGAYGVPADLTGKWADLPAHALSDAEVANLKAGPAVNVGAVTVAFDYDKFAAAVTAGIHNL